MTGTVKFFVTDRDYGFIEPDDGELDYYFKRASVLDERRKPVTGNHVRFEVEDHPKGPVAVSIEILV